ALAPAAPVAALVRGRGAIDELVAVLGPSAKTITPRCCRACCAWRRGRGTHTGRFHTSASGARGNGERSRDAPWSAARSTTQVPPPPPVQLTPTADGFITFLSTAFAASRPATDQVTPCVLAISMRSSVDPGAAQVRST